MDSSADTNSLTGLNILVVEDDNDTRELLRVLLEAQGGTVRAASSVSEGLQRTINPDPIFSWPTSGCPITTVTR